MSCPANAPPAGSIQFPCVLPVALVDEGGAVLFVIVVLGVVYNTWRWRKTLALTGNAITQRGFLGKVPAGMVKVLTNEVAIQRSIFDCGKIFWVSHFAIFWGFIGAAATTTLLYIFHPDGSALPLTDPIKILGNVSAVLLTVGGFIAIQRRLRDPLLRGNTLYYDSIFLVLLYGSAISGVFTELSRLSVQSSLAYGLYFAHLVFVGLLLGLAPWTKFVHALYRPIIHLLDGISLSMERPSAKAVSGSRSK